MKCNIMLPYLNEAKTLTVIIPYLYNCTRCKVIKSIGVMANQ